MFGELFRRLPDIEITGEPDMLLLELHPRHQAHALQLHAGRRSSGRQAGVERIAPAF